MRLPWPAERVLAALADSALEAAWLTIVYLGVATLCFVWIGTNLRPSRESIHPARSPVPGHGVAPRNDLRG